MPQPLRLLAAAADDVPVISAVLQDAVLRVADIRYDPRGRQLTLVVQRLDRMGYPQRITTVLQIGQVLRVQVAGFDPRAEGQVLQILTIDGDAEMLQITCAEGAGLRVYIEDIDLVLADVSPPRPVRHLPDHGL